MPATPNWYANATANTYTINFNNSDGSGSASTTVTYNSSTNTKVTVPTRTGYNFTGYEYTASGTSYLVYDSTGTAVKSPDSLAVGLPYFWDNNGISAKCKLTTNNVTINAK